MNKSKKGSPRQMNFADAVKYVLQVADERSDAKFLENSKQITGPLASLKTRVEVLEDLIMEKMGETEASLSERVLERVEKQQGFVQVSTPVELGSIVRIKVKEEVVGSESPTTEMQDAFLVVGQNQVHPQVDELLIGANTGDTKSTIIANPKIPEQQVKITVFLARVFQGRNIPNAPQVETAPETTPQAAQN